MEELQSCSPEINFHLMPVWGPILLKVYAKKINSFLA